MTVVDVLSPEDIEKKPQGRSLLRHQAPRPQI